MYSLPNESLSKSGIPSLKQRMSAATSRRPIVGGVTPGIARSSDKWYLMRVSYGRERQAAAILEEKGVQVFLPTITRMRIIAGRKKRCTESLISNFLFVRSTEETLRRYIGCPPLEYLHHYYIPARDADGNPVGHKGIKPLVIPDRQMEQFMIWHRAADDHKIFMPQSASQSLKEGEKVRVLQGKFAGITGFVCRVRQQSRVGVHIDGLGTVITAYIPRAFLERFTP